MTTTVGITIRNAPRTECATVAAYACDQRFRGWAASGNGRRQVGSVRYVTTRYTPRATRVTCLNS
ncbi:hypothetical protein [Streptomyces sp. SM11]|uniref:hypothetical protein n=1 Tax=Streptomyces sp. SM11 TaxID=565557 RepID=UPI000CD55E02|nr:hypothetical protein [Streptomyces sp. SM11]